MQETYFGKVYAVINDKPHIFTVTGIDLTPSSSDPLNRLPLAYAFRHHKSLGQARIDGFTVKVTDELIRFFFSDNVKGLHNEAIRFGLRSIKDSPTESEFIFKTSDFKKSRERLGLAGFELRLSILGFIRAFYEMDPTDGVSVYDLLDNYYSSEDDIGKWCRVLRDEGLVEQVRDWRIYRQNRSQVKTAPFRIVPTRIEDVDKLISTTKANGGSKEGAAIRVFLSYSHRNRLVARKVKDGLEEYGMEVFLAHEDLEPSAEWEATIIENLKICDFFIPILKEHFDQSLWTHQESGFAFALDKCIIPLKFRKNPAAFLARYQAQPYQAKKLDKTFQEIASFVASTVNTARRFRRGLIYAFGASFDFNEAIRKSELLCRFSDYTEDEITMIVSFIEKNDQIHNCDGARAKLRRFFQPTANDIPERLRKKALGLLS